MLRSKGLICYYSKLIKSFGYGYKWKYLAKNDAEEAAKLKSKHDELNDTFFHHKVYSGLSVNGELPDTFKQQLVHTGLCSFKQTIPLYIYPMKDPVHVKIFQTLQCHYHIAFDICWA